MRKIFMTAKIEPHFHDKSLKFEQSNLQHKFLSFVRLSQLKFKSETPWVLLQLSSSKTVGVR